MYSKKSRAAHLTIITPRQWMGRLSLILLLILSLAVMAMGQANNQSLLRFRASLMDSLAEVAAVAAKPVDAVAGVGVWFGEMANLRAENIALKNENIKLLQWQSIAKSMEAENQSLRAIAHAVSIPKSNYVTTRIVSDMGGPYVRSALIGGGAGQGIKKDQAVINERGLVGRVVETGNTSSRVLLLSDINSRIPVMGESSREKTILIGNNNELPSLSYLAADSSIKVGERIITSGDGGVFPRGIAVGVVTQIDKGIVRVQPFVDPASIEYVSVVDYSL